MNALQASPPVCADDGRPAAGALEQAFARWQPELLGTLCYLVGNTEDARDALQETFVKCWRHRHEVTEIENLKAWIFRVVLNTGRDVRGTAWRRRRQQLPEDDGMVESHNPNPADEVEMADEMERIRLAVRQLREEEQEVFLLRQNAELTYDEIAEAMGIPAGTVKTRMRLALIKLRQVLAEPTA
jgi:RNA polymerase sigma-70 factor (ECF subfamily)